MALQSLTTTPTPSGTETVAPPPGPDDTNANSGLLGNNGTQPLVPAFILSGLLIVGIVMMCWWKRLSARRVALGSAPGTDTSTPLGMNVVIGAGRGMGAGMIVLAARGAEWQVDAGQNMRRKKDAKLGPRPKLWDVYLESEALTNEVKVARWNWRKMRPLSASYVSTHPRFPDPTQGIPPNDSSNSAASVRKDDQIVQHMNSQPVPQPPPPPPRLRISVFITMPTPRLTHSGHAEDRKHAESGTDSEAHLGVGKSLDSLEQNLGDANLVLGISEVPVKHRDEL